MSSTEQDRLRIGIEALARNNHITSLYDAEAIRGKYPPTYKKIHSTVGLGQIGFPILPGFVVDALDDDVFRVISNWVEDNGFQRLSIRFDSPRPEDHVKLTSSNPTMVQLDAMRENITPPIAAMIMAENDRYAQKHSVTTTFEPGSLILEVVGPGFDSRDVTRGFTTPHERIRIRSKRGSNDTDYQDLHPSDILEHTIAYELATRDIRIRRRAIYVAIQASFGRTAGIDKPLTESEETELDFLLRERGISLPRQYGPIEHERLSELYGYLSELDVFAKYHAEQHGLFVVGKTLAASFLKRYGLVFWDLYGAEKYKHS